MDNYTKEAPLVYTLSVFPSKKVLKSYMRSISEIAGIMLLLELWSQKTSGKDSTG